MACEHRPWCYLRQGRRRQGSQERSRSQICSGDVWNVQPAPKDHVWRTMKNPLGGGNGMVPHYSGTTLDAQARYAAGTKSILEHYFDGSAQEPQNIIVGLGKYETKACKCSI